jgi:hypothetical protein
MAEDFYEIVLFKRGVVDVSKRFGTQGRLRADSLIEGNAAKINEGIG